MSLLRAALTKRKAATGSNKITLGVGTTAHGATSSSTTCTTSAITTTSGSDVYVVLAWANTSSPGTVTDSKSNTWTQVGTTIYSATDGTGMTVYKATNIAGGSGHTFTVTGASGAGYICMAVQEFKNTNHTTDQTHQGTATSGTGPYVSGNITTTNANDALIGFGYVDSEAASQAITSNSPLSIAQSLAYGNTYLGCAISYQFVTTTQTVQASFSGSPNGTWGGALITSVESS